jgi:hypothetical protein
VGTKQSRHACNKLGRPDCLLSMSALSASSLCFVPATSTCFSLCFLQWPLTYYINNNIGSMLHRSVYINEMPKAGNTKGYHCTVHLLFDWFGLVCFAYNNKKISVVIQLIPKQLNRRSMVQ